MPARRELAPERDHREGVTGLAEGGEQEPAAFRIRRLQTSSASVRSVPARCSEASPVGETTRVPTPASW